MAGETLVVDGYREFMRAIQNADRDTKRMLRNELRNVGDSVRADGQGRLAPYSPKSAGGYRTVVRQRGIAVEQRYRKTTGKHPEFGPFQMRKALVPALEANEDRFNRDLEHALDRICDQAERRP